MKIENMKVGSYYLKHDEIEEESWSELRLRAQFDHTSECELMFYISGDFNPNEIIWGISEKDEKTLLTIIEQAQKDGYKYLCIHSG